MSDQQYIVNGVTGPGVVNERTAKRISFVRGAEPMDINSKQLPASHIASASPPFAHGGALYLSGQLTLLVDADGQE